VPDEAARRSYDGPMSRIPPLVGTALGLVLALLAATPTAATPTAATPTAATPTAGAATAGATAPGPGRADAASYAADAVRATNAARARRGLRPLGTTRCLRRAAARQAAAMARKGSIWHQDLGVVMRDCGLGAVGENVAAGYPTGRAVVRGWMGSSGHRANILQPRFRLVAVAARRSGSGTWYAAQVFGRR
jgi:uncharacterized protein YkwD